MCQSSASVLLGKAVAFEILRMTQGAARKRHICKAHQEPPVLAVSRVGTGRRWSEETAPPWSSIAQAAAQHAPNIFQTFSLSNAHIVWAAKHSFAANLLDPDSLPVLIMRGTIAREKIPCNFWKGIMRHFENLISGNLVPAACLILRRQDMSNLVSPLWVCGWVVPP